MGFFDVRQSFIKRLDGFWLLVVILLIGLQFLSGCGGCGGSEEEEDAVAGVQGEACTDPGKATVGAYGVHYPCDICANPVDSNVNTYPDCGSGYAVGDIKSFKSEIDCNTSGTHTINYTNIKHGTKPELGYSSYNYSGSAGSGSYSNSSNPPIDGCAEVGGSECGPTFSSSFVNPTQWGVNIVWPCSKEVTMYYSKKYTSAFGPDIDGYGHPGAGFQYDEEFGRSFKCPTCTWRYTDGSDRYLIIMTDIFYCADVDNESGFSAAYAKYTYNVYTATGNSSETKVEHLYGETDHVITECD